MAGSGTGSGYFWIRRLHSLSGLLLAFAYILGFIVPFTAAFGGADLHFHSTASDGVESPETLAALAAAAGLSVAVLTDHDAVHGVPAFVAAARGTGLVAAGGAELSVDEAADIAGYSSSAAFIRAFNREFGATPLQWRKLQTAEESLGRLRSGL